MKIITVALDTRDVQIILDTLTSRMNPYEHTANFLNDEDHNLDNFLIEEVSDANEATTLANTYRRIIEEITHQL